MSNTHTHPVTSLDAQTVQQIATLSRLSLDAHEAAAFASSLSTILASMAHLATIDTTGIEPLKSPFDHPQPLRDDTVTEHNHRDAYQAVAPVVQDGLYLVPRVIE